MNPELQAIQKKYKNKKDQASMLKQQEEMHQVYDKYGSFKAPVFTHMIANLTAVIGTSTGIFNGFAKSPEILGVTVVICTFVAAVMFTMIQKMDTGLKPEQPSDKSDDSQKPNLDMFR